MEVADDAEREQLVGGGAVALAQEDRVAPAACAHTHMAAAAAAAMAVVGGVDRNDRFGYWIQDGKVAAAGEKARRMLLLCGGRMGRGCSKWLRFAPSKVADCAIPISFEQIAPAEHENVV